MNIMNNNLLMIYPFDTNELFQDGQFLDWVFKENILIDLDAVSKKAFPLRTSSERKEELKKFLMEYYQMWETVGNLNIRYQNDYFRDLGILPLYDDINNKNITQNLRPFDRLVVFKQYERALAEGVNTGDILKDWYTAQELVANDLLYHKKNISSTV